jgi:hypothetical protein
MNSKKLISHAGFPVPMKPDQSQQLITPDFDCCQKPLEFMLSKALSWQKYVPLYASCNNCGTDYEVSPSGHLFLVTPDRYLCCAETLEDVDVAIIETATRFGDIYLEYFPYCKTHEKRPPNSVEYDPNYEELRLYWFMQRLVSEQMQKIIRLH